MKLAGFTAIALTILPVAARAGEPGTTATVSTHSAASVSPPAQRAAQSAPVAPAAIESPDFATARPVAVTAPPVYAYPQPFVRARTRRSDRREPLFTGGAIPPGTHVETRRNTPLLVTGSVLFGSAYLGSALAGAQCSANPRCTTGLEWLFVPFGGPFIALAYPHTSESTGPLVLAGVMQTASLTFVIAGIILSHRVLVEDPYDGPFSESRSPQWSLVPSAPGAVAGMSFSLTYY